MPAALPVTAITTVDPVLRETTTMGVVCDLPGAVVLAYTPQHTGLRRTITDVTGRLEDELAPVEHCVSCTLRDDALATLERLAQLGRWSAAAVALPVGVEAAPLSRALAFAGEPVTSSVRLTSVVSVVDVDTLEDDLFGDDLLTDRGLAGSATDRRSVGEALAHQVEFADVVVTAGHPSQASAGSDLLDHVRAADSTRWDGLHEFSAGTLVEPHHDPARAQRRVDPRLVQPSRAGDGAWSIDLAATRPLHPQRLLDSIAELGGGRLRARGRFWLPTRPLSVCAWDGAGGQLSIGEVGGWAGVQPSTRIVVTGTGREHDRLRRAFDRVVFDDRELAAGLAPWAGLDDGFDPWLGEIDPDAGYEDESAGGAA